MFFLMILAVFVGLVWFANSLVVYTFVMPFYPKPRKLLCGAALLTAVFIVQFMVFDHGFPDIYRYTNNYLGVLNFAFWTCSAYWLVKLCLQLVKVRFSTSKAVALGLAVFSVGVSLFASWQFGQAPSVAELTLSSQKVSREYRFVQLSDIQFGTSNKQEMDAILHQAYALKPDFIVFTGDLIDFDGYVFDDFEVLAASPVPMYFERGNHEFYHHPDRLMRYLSQFTALTVLKDQAVIVDELQIVGLDYQRDKASVAPRLQQLPLQPDKFKILLYHEPKAVAESSAFGFDLQLYGHTHAGQIWPFTWVVDWIYDYADGVYQLNDTVIYTSDGASLWGPRMRLGSRNEMTLVTIKPLAER